MAYDSDFDPYWWGDGSGRAEANTRAQLLEQYSSDSTRNAEIDRLITGTSGVNVPAMDSDDMVVMNNQSVLNSPTYKSRHGLPKDNSIVDYSNGNGGFDYNQMPWNQPAGGVLSGSYSGGWKDPEQAKARIQQMGDLGSYLRSDAISAAELALATGSRADKARAVRLGNEMKAWDNNASTYENLYKIDTIQNAINKDRQETLDATQYVNNLEELKWNKTKSVKDKSKTKESVDIDSLREKLKKIGSTQENIKEEDKFTPENLSLLDKYETLTNKVYVDKQAKKDAISKFIENNASQEDKDKEYDILTTTSKNLENAFMGKNLGKDSLDELYKGDYLTKLKDLSRKRSKIRSANERIDTLNKDKLKKQEMASIDSTRSRWDGSMKDETTPISSANMVENIKQRKRDAIRNLKDKPAGMQIKALKDIEKKYNFDLQRVQSSINTDKVRKKAQNDLNTFKTKEIFKAKIDVRKTKQIEEIKNGLIEGGYTDKMASDIVKAATAADMSIEEYMNKMAKVKGYSN